MDWDSERHPGDATENGVFIIIIIIIIIMTVS